MVKLKPRAKDYQPSFNIKKNLNISKLLSQISHGFAAIPNQRRESHCQYKQSDAMMAALSGMFFQQPSWLQFQQQLQEGFKDNNLARLFHVTALPSDTQCREIMDQIDSEYYRTIFNDLFEQLRCDKPLERFKLPLVEGGIFYLPMDGSTYHSSKKVNCACCLTKKHANGQITYQHQVLQGAIMHPDCRQVLPLMPEPVLNGDGQKKQDCEHNAAKRFLTKLRNDHPRLPLLIGGDGLFSNGPMIQHTLSLGLHYLFTCKPGDHPFLMDYLTTFEDWRWMEHIDLKKNQTHRYRWRNSVPLSEQKDAPQVNYLEYEMLKDGKVVYRGSWVTDLEISLSNIFQLIKTGRCRWKIESVPQAHKKVA